jgi:hypothetical protein
VSSREDYVPPRRNERETALEWVRRIKRQMGDPPTESEEDDGNGDSARDAGGDGGGGAVP